MLEIKPENIDQLIDSITSDIYQKLRTAVEVGKWESGQPLSEVQKEHCMQVIIAYEHRHVPVDQRTGFMSPATLAGSRCAKEQDQ